MYCDESTGLEGRLWYPAVPSASSWISKSPERQLGDDFTFEDLHEQAHLMDFFFWESGDNDEGLDEFIFYGQDIEDKDGTKQYVSGIGVRYKDGRVRNITFEGMKLDKVLNTFSLEEGEELVNIHFLSEDDRDSKESRLRLYELGIFGRRLIDVVVSTSFSYAQDVLQHDTQKTNTLPISSKPPTIAPHHSFHQQVLAGLWLTSGIMTRMIHSI